MTEEISMVKFSFYRYSFFRLFMMTKLTEIKPGISEKM